jgi:hypothetical protein
MAKREGLAKTDPKKVPGQRQFPIALCDLFRRECCRQLEVSPSMAVYVLRPTTLALI